MNKSVFLYWFSKEFNTVMSEQISLFFLQECDIKRAFVYCCFFFIILVSIILQHLESSRHFLVYIFKRLKLCSGYILYCCQSCQINTIQMGWTTWAIWAANKETQPQSRVSHLLYTTVLQLLHA